ncbi:MAG: SpoIID/LytB domain-containing protein [Ignavibacteriales bacterium]|nr:SpoIID/LytB domain-containing protein [Ignavibacteriales bacterium]
MITTEPIITVGIIEHLPSLRGEFHGTFRIDGAGDCSGAYEAIATPAGISLRSGGKEIAAPAKMIRCVPVGDATFTVFDVVIGVNFHWERKENQTFQGALRLVQRDDGTLSVINEVALEQYLASVISSEMSATAPMELLEAHAITSRSWLAAMLEREQAEKNVGVPSQRCIEKEGEIVRWYDREDHDIFDVCADDHCQRYQGISKIISANAAAAIKATRGVFLVYDNTICDARFYKACGGLTELFENSWENVHVPYIECVSDAAHQHPPIATEEEAQQWIRSNPDAYCNTRDGNVLRMVLPSFDQETTDFFRWTVTYKREELEEILTKKSGIDFGTLMDLVPVQRGPSGRIFRLKIVGTKKSVIVGKELEIRRWLSKSHLYSGAFVVDTERDGNDVPLTFALRGAGWGHGAGLCQIGAAVMAVRGFKPEQIVKHYFPGAEVKKLY